ncbi:radical SAM protein [Paenibacillus larvae subsp. larvae]|uniref:radical SAM protein n=1 Tax=Paenibacillus larvae TaxID=1464 RepID=UPI0023A962D4|nr:radical SAM protein [Paenibacillus larvae]MDE5137878.1 radical SAM protein [Paenibacillus larvae subsp. larvae]
MSNCYFRLFPECFLVVGRKKSVVCHLLDENMIWLDEVNTQKLKDAEANHPVNAEDPFFSELESTNFGFFSDQTVFIDKLRPINSFSQKKLWQDAPRINMAVLHVTNDCNLDCTFCKNSFCPVCKRFEERDEAKLTVEQWKRILTELSHFGTSAVLFTGGEPTRYPYIHELIDFSIELGMATNLHTNGLVPLKQVPSVLGFHITVTSKRNLNKIIQNYCNIKDRVTLLVDDHLFSDVKQITGNQWKIMRTTHKKPSIVKERLVKTNMNSFYARKLFDPCLNGKIAVSYVGDVYPCLGSQAPLLNLKRDSVSQAVKLLVRDFWRQNVDSRDHGLKCRECEFKYSCSACRFLDTEENCAYSLEESEWL